MFSSIKRNECLMSFDYEGCFSFMDRDSALSKTKRHYG